MSATSTAPAVHPVRHHVYGAALAIGLLEDLDLQRAALRTRLGAALRDARMALGWSLGDAAERLRAAGHVGDKSNISRLERGQGDWSMPMCKALAALYWDASHHGAER